MKYRLVTFIKMVCLFSSTAFAGLPYGGESYFQVRERVQRIPVSKLRMLANFELYDGPTYDFLLEDGIDLNDRSGRGLDNACINNYTEVVRFFLEEGVNPNDGYSGILVTPCERGYTEIIKLLLQYGANPNRNSWALIKADGHPEIIKLLLQYGADPNAEDGLALIGAAMRGDLEIVRLLLEYKADLYAQDGKALVEAFACYLEGNGVNATTMRCPSNNKEIVELFLQYGAVLQGQTARMCDVACERGDLKIVQFLGANGVNSNTQPGAALVQAASCVCPQVVTPPLENETKPDIQGGAEIAWVAQCIGMEIGKLLFLYGAVAQETEALILGAGIMGGKMVEFLFAQEAVESSQAKTVRRGSN